MLFKKKPVKYIGSTNAPISSSLEIIKVLWVCCFFGFFFFPENCDKTEKVGAKIADRFKFSILSLLSNEAWHVCLKVGSVLYEGTCPEWLHLVYSKYDRL